MIEDESAEFLETIRKIIGERGVSAMLLIDAQGQPILVPIPGHERVTSSDAKDEEPIVQTRTYSLTTTCRACKNGKRRCCYQMGGETNCYTKPC